MTHALRAPGLMMREQDQCLIAITDGRPLPAASIAQLPPWRAVLIARVADKAGIPLEGGTLDDLVAEASRVGGEGDLVWPLRLPRSATVADCHDPV